MRTLFVCVCTSAPLAYGKSSRPLPPSIRGGNRVNGPLKPTAPRTKEPGGIKSWVSGPLYRQQLTLWRGLLFWWKGGGGSCPLDPRPRSTPSRHTHTRISSKALRQLSPPPARRSTPPGGNGTGIEYKERKKRWIWIFGSPRENSFHGIRYWRRLKRFPCPLGACQKN